jgi:hypothetical protein
VAEDQLTGCRDARQRKRIVRLLGRQEASGVLDIGKATSRKDRPDDR